jgi:hypothetical protein
MSSRINLLFRKIVNSAALLPFLRGKKHSGRTKAGNVGQGVFYELIDK